MDKERCVEAVERNAWSSFRIDEPRVVWLGAESGIVAYKATAERTQGAAPYVAYMSTGYVKRAGAWKVAFHQQTPIVEG
jgi:hypothetical protein